MAADKALEAGEQAPEFALPDAGGNIRRLSEMCSGGVLVLVFYRGHW
jgi:peroxiredoxin